MQSHLGWHKRYPINKITKLLGSNFVIYCASYILPELELVLKEVVLQPFLCLEISISLGLFSDMSRNLHLEEPEEANI